MDYNDNNMKTTTTTNDRVTASDNPNKQQQQLSVTNTSTTDDNNEVYRATNEYVLNVAFLSFLIFTAVQFFFALLAKSESMMTDCAAMMVDVVTYLFNFMAERLKHGHVGMSARDLRLRRLYMELIPPSISVITLIIVTVMALQEAFKTLVSKNHDEEDEPDLVIMLLFSGLNLLLDILNVGCFARVDQAIGLPGQETRQPHGHHHHHEHDDNDNNNNNNTGIGQTTLPVADESTPLVMSMRTDEDGSKTDVDNESTTSSSEESTDATGILNLNMCSAWTHVCADTLRSIAVLIAAGISKLFPNILTASEADSDAAILVSIIILISLVPLIQGLFLTACKIYYIWFGRKDEHGNSERSNTNKTYNHPNKKYDLVV